MGVLPWPGGCALHLLRLVVGRRAGSQQRRSYARGAASSPLWDDPVHRLGSDVLRRMVLGLFRCVAVSVQRRGHWWRMAAGRVGGDRRSEEHTSELQSLMRISYA